MLTVSNWQIDRFGHFQDVAHGPLGPGLNVLWGPNEAGKSTLLAFLAWSLFGAKDTRGRERDLTLGAAGTLWLSGPEGRFTLARQGTRLSLTGPDGQAADPGQLLRHVDRRLFRAVYAFDLADLVGLSDLGDDALKERLYGAASAGGGPSVAAIRKELAKELDTLWRPRAGCRIRDLQGELKAANAALREAKANAHGLPTREAALAVLRDEAGALGAALTQNLERGARLTALLDALPSWRQLVEVEAALDAPSGPLLDDAAWEALQALFRDADDAHTRHEEAHTTASEAEARVKALPAPDPILAHRDAIAHVERQVDAIEARVAEQARAEGELPHAATDLEAALHEAGAALTRDAARLIRPTIAQRAALLHDGKRLADARRGLDAERRALDARDQRLADEVAALDAQHGALAQDPEAAAALPAVRDLTRRWRDEIAARSDALPALEAAAEAARKAADAALTALGLHAIADVPAVAPELVDSLAKRCDDAVRGVSKATDGLETAASAEEEALRALSEGEATLRDTPAPGPHLGHATKIRDLAARVSQALEARSAAQRASAARDGHAASLASLLTELGCTEDALPGATLTVAARDALATQCRAVQERTQDLTTLRRQRDELGEAAGAPDPARADALTARKEAIAKAEGLLRDQDRRIEARGVPWVALALVGLVGLLGALTFVVGLLLPSPIPIVLGGALLALAVALALVLVIRTAATSPGAGRDAALDAALRALDLPPTAGFAELQAARERTEHELAAARAAAEAHAARRAADERIDRAERAHTGALDALAASLRANALPVTLGPDAAMAYVAVLEDAIATRREVTHQERALVAQQSAWKSFATEARTLLVAVGQHEAASLSTALAEAQTALGQDEERAQALHLRTVEVDQLRRAHAASGRALAAAQEAARLSRQTAAQCAEALAAAGLPATVGIEDGSRWLFAARDAHRAHAEAASRAVDLKEKRALVRRWDESVRALQLRLEAPVATLDALRARCEEAAAIAEQAAGLGASLSAKREEQQRCVADAEALDGRERAWHDAQRAWVTARDQAGVPTAIAPEEIEAFFAALDRVRAADERVARLDRALLQSAESIQTFRSAVDALCTELALAKPDTLPEAIRRVTELSERAKEAAQEATRRKGHEETARDARATEEARALVLAQHEKALKEALAAHGLDTRAAAHHAHQAHQARRDLDQRRDALVRALDAQLRGFDEEARTLLDTADVAAWTIARDDLVAARPGLEERREAHTKRIGVEEAALEALKRQSDVIERAHDAAGLQDALAEAVRQYATLRLSDHLLAAALERFKRDKQPGVLRRASALWSMVTHGAWVQVRSKVEDEALEVVDAGGHAHAPERLSRGTADQLYLCLRLALAESLSEGGAAQIPLVLDDVLVNFDAERAEACAAVLAAVARERQVLLFTCREASVAALREAAHGALNVIALPRFAGREIGAPITPIVTATPARRLAPSSSDVLQEDVIAVLKQASEPLALSLIASTLSVAPEACRTTIQSLRDMGLVEKIGRKRGTRYQLSEGAVANGGEIR